MPQLFRIGPDNKSLKCCDDKKKKQRRKHQKQEQLDDL